MSTDTQLQDAGHEYRDDGYAMDGELYEPYRSVSKMAVFSVLLAILALLGLLFPMLLLFALLAALLGLTALRNISQYPDELTGRTAAILGTVGGLLLLLGGLTGAGIGANPRTRWEPVELPPERSSSSSH